MYKRQQPGEGERGRGKQDAVAGADRRDAFHPGQYVRGRRAIVDRGTGSRARRGEQTGGEDAGRDHGDAGGEGGIEHRVPSALVEQRVPVRDHHDVDQTVPDEIGETSGRGGPDADSLDDSLVLQTGQGFEAAAGSAVPGLIGVVHEGNVDGVEAQSRQALFQ